MTMHTIRCVRCRSTFEWSSHWGGPPEQPCPDCRRRRVLDVLTEHQRAFRDAKDPFYCSGCKWVAVVVADGANADGVSIGDQHLAHVAEMITDTPAPTTRVAPVRAQLAARRDEEM